MKTKYILPTITVLDYKLETYLDTFSGDDMDEDGDVKTKYRGDGTIPIVDMGGDDDW